MENFIPKPPIPVETWTCRDCGAKNHKDDIFCSICDSRNPNDWVCPNCGTVNENYRLTCIDCYSGAPLNTMTKKEVTKPKVTIVFLNPPQ